MSEQSLTVFLQVRTVVEYQPKPYGIDLERRALEALVPEISPAGIATACATKSDFMALLEDTASKR